MPIYEYRCHECEQIFEEWQKDFAERQVPCPVCGSGSERLISSSAFHLKGSGWYVTDYCKGKTSSGGNGNGSCGEKPSGGEAATAAPEPKSEAKTETKAETKAETKTASPCAAACASGGASS